jgi:tetratricopeptide (TPR) repeat protein
MRFNHLLLGLHPYKAQSNQVRYEQLYVSLGVNVIDQVDFGPFNISTQLGAYSVGTSDLHQNTAFNTYFVDYAFTHYISINDLPFYTIFTTFLSESGDFDQGVVFGISKNNQSIFFEFDGLTNQVYLGLDTQLMSQLQAGLMINVSKNQQLDNPLVFYPSVKFGVKVNDVFSSKPKEVAVKPLDVDNDSFTLMEKALLAYNESKFDSAANLYSQVIEKYPNYVLPYVRLGNCYYQLKQWELAKRSWSTALKLDPTNDDVFMALVRLKNRQIQTQRIIEGA